MSAKAAAAYFAFGRFQPPTKGHELLISTVAKKAREDGADAFVFTSNTCNAGKEGCRNPLAANIKVGYMKKMFSEIPITIVNGAEMGANNPFAAFKYLLNRGYKDITLFAGSDRYSEYKTRIDRIGIANYHVVSVGGVRDENAEGVEGISGTKARAMALLNNIEAFSSITKMGSMKNTNVIALRENLRTSMKRASASKKSAPLSVKSLSANTRKRQRSRSSMTPSKREKVNNTAIRV